MFSLLNLYLFWGSVILIPGTSRTLLFSQKKPDGEFIFKLGADGREPGVREGEESKTVYFI